MRQFCVCFLVKKHDKGRPYDIIKPNKYAENEFDTAEAALACRNRLREVFNDPQSMAIGTWEVVNGWETRKGMDLVVLP